LRAPISSTDFVNQGRQQLALETGEDVSVLDVQNVMERMQQRNRELFKVPPYILYVARAFSTLEGIGLSANEDYSIVSEAFPYLSKRLLTDSSPRAEAALRSMVYGSSDAAIPYEAPPSIDQMLKMGAGFNSYSTVTSSAPVEAAAALPAAASAAAASAATGTAAGAAATEPTGAAAGAGDELVDLLLAADGTYVQQLLLEEAAKLADAAVRQGVARAGSTPLASGVAAALRAPRRFADATFGRLPMPGPLRSVLDTTLLAPVTALDELAALVPSLAARNGSSSNGLE
jgi:hypothetical protein